MLNQQTIEKLHALKLPGMAEALKEARKAARKGEVPVGAELDVRLQTALSSDGRTLESIRIPFFAASSTLKDAAGVSGSGICLTQTTTCMPGIVARPARSIPTHSHRARALPPDQNPGRHR